MKSSQNAGSVRMARKWQVHLFQNLSNATQTYLLKESGSTFQLRQVKQNRWGKLGRGWGPGTQCYWKGPGASLERKGGCWLQASQHHTVVPKTLADISPGVVYPSCLRISWGVCSKCRFLGPILPEVEPLKMRRWNLHLIQITRGLIILMLLSSSLWQR